MAGGKRFKFTGSTIAVLTGFDANSPSLNITGITNANPAVVSVANHGLADGDVVKIANVAGMTEVNNEAYIVNVLTSGTFQLADTNSTGWGAYTSGGKMDEGSFSNFCELTGYNRSGGSSPEIDADSLCSVAKEYEIGLPDYGTTQIDFNFAPRTAIQTAVQAFYTSGEKLAVKVVLPNSGGEMVQLGFVQQTSEQVGKGGLWTGSMTIRNTGPRFDVAAA
jgi:Ubiquitin-activating enzyme E1 FCCH domain